MLVMSSLDDPTVAFIHTGLQPGVCALGQVE